MRDLHDALRGVEQLLLMEVLCFCQPGHMWVSFNRIHVFKELGRRQFKHWHENIAQDYRADDEMKKGLLLLPNAFMTRRFFIFFLNPKKIGAFKLLCCIKPIKSALIAVLSAWREHGLTLTPCAKKPRLLSQGKSQNSWYPEQGDWGVNVTQSPNVADLL